MRALLLALAAGCVDAPETGRIYTCSSTFVCDGVGYDVAPARQCIPDGEDPEAVYVPAVFKAAGEARCAEASVEDVLCATGPLSFCRP